MPISIKLRRENIIKGLCKGVVHVMRKRRYNAKWKGVLRLSCIKRRNNAFPKGVITFFQKSASLFASHAEGQAPPPPNIVDYKTKPQLWENTQIYNLSLKSPLPNNWVRTQTRNLSTYSNYFRYLCTYLKFVLKHLFDHLFIHLYFGVDFIMKLFIF